MTYEERMKDFCLHCPQRCKEQACGYVMRNLERDCIYLQDVMTGWELGQQDTIEAKEVDLEKEIDDAFLENKCNITDNVSLAEFVRIAKHFYSLGLKVQKGEKV